VSIRNVQRRPVKRSPFEGDPRIRQSPQKRGKCANFFAISIYVWETEDLSVGQDPQLPVELQEVGPSGIELDHLLQRQVTAGVEVRAREINIPEARSLEGT